MKKFALFFMCMIMALAVNAQWLTKGSITYLKPYGSYVGIGTDKPTAPLHVIGNGIVTGNATIGGNAAITGAATVGGNATVTGNAVITGTATITAGLIGSAPVRGSSAFTEGQTVKKVPLPGCTTTDFCFVQITQADTTSNPPAGDLIRVYPKADTLVVIRTAGTTSGLTFDWFRLK